MDSRPEFCPSCDEVRDFVQPPCADGHTADGGECPDWACVECGTALGIGGTVVVTLRPRARLAA